MLVIRIIRYPLKHLEYLIGKEHPRSIVGRIGRLLGEQHY